jgi:glycosyltransferase involved in cell wall biosynthesis
LVNFPVLGITSSVVGVSKLLSHLLVNLSFLIPKPTGLATYAKNIFPHLTDLNPTLLVADTIPGYHCHRVPANMNPDAGKWGHLKRLLWTQFRLPSVYQRSRASLLFSPIPEAPLQSNCRHVVTVHDLIPLRFPRRFSPLIPYHRYYIPQVLREAEHIICDSEATGKDIVDFLQIPAKKITPVPLAYDASHFRFLDLPTQNYFFYIGRHDAYKNLSRLVAAFAKIAKFGDCQLWIAGPSDSRYTLQLRQQAEELGVSQQVKFVGYIDYDQLPKVLNQALALVFPSLWEGFGLPILEAMACGTPVVTSNISSMPEVAGDAALLVNPYEIEEIAEAMKAIATDSQLRSRLRVASLQRSRQFSWEKTGNQTASILQQFC